MSLPDAGQVLDARSSALASGAVVVGEPYRPGAADAGDNEYCFFLKPELFAGTRQFEPVWRLVTERLAHFDQTAQGWRVLPGAYLARHDVMAAHYGVINRVSREGVGALTRETVERIHELCGADVPVFGGHAYLRQNPAMTPEELAGLHDRSGSTRVAGGTHVIRVTGPDGPVAILNGFHPAQLAYYYRDDAAIVVFVVRTALDWASIRQRLTGATKPQEAAADSIRGMLLARQAELGLPEISPMYNGVHASAGPVEGMVEICRYGSDLDRSAIVRPEDTNFGRQAAQLLGAAILPRLDANPLIKQGEREVSLFDATEELDTHAALELLAEHATELA